MSEMKHLTQEDLIEYHFAETEHRPQRQQHLASCPECAANLAALVHDLNRAATELEPLPPPARGAEYGERVWRTIAPALTAQPARQPRWVSSALSPGFRAGLAFAACAALVAASFYAGHLWEKSRNQHLIASLPPTTEPAKIAPAKPADQPKDHADNKPANPTRTPPQLIVFVLSDHLDRSERLLVELNHPNEAAVDPALRSTAQELLSANRAYRTGKHRQNLPGDQSLGIALDSLERVLTEIASKPGGLGPGEIAALQSKLNTDSLLFEIRVLRARATKAHQQAGQTSDAARKGRAI